MIPYTSYGSANWSHIPVATLSQLGGLFFFKCNFDLKLIKFNVPIAFYKEASDAWQTINSTTPCPQKRNT